MSVKLKLDLTLSDLSDSDATSLFKLDSPFQAVRKLADTFQAVVGGNLKGTAVVATDEAATPATGTVTLASVLAGDTVTFNGVAFTAVSGAPSGNEFDISGTDTAAAASLVTQFNASATALISGYATAASAAGVVTFTSSFRGTAGNQATLASSNGTRLAVSAARLASGAADATAKTYTF